MARKTKSWSPPVPQIRANNRIKAREVLVIDIDGKSLGTVPIAEAMTTARRRGLDLVEVSPNATPPVCRILDFGKYRYEISKRDRDGKKNTSATKVKELKFHLNIDPHDYEVKMRQAEAFMMRGMKVKLILAFRGREMMHQERGIKLVVAIRADLIGAGTADSEPRLIGKNITMMLTPNPTHKRVRKFTREDDIISDEDDSTPEGHEEEADDEGLEGDHSEITKPERLEKPVIKTTSLEKLEAMLRTENVEIELVPKKNKGVEKEPQHTKADAAPSAKSVETVSTPSLAVGPETLPTAPDTEGIPPDTQPAVPEPEPEPIAPPQAEPEAPPTPEIIPAPEPDPIAPPEPQPISTPQPEMARSVKLAPLPNA